VRALGAWGRWGPLAHRAAGDYALSTMATPVVQNLDGAGVDTRMRQAVLGLGVTLAALVGLAASHAPVWLAAFLFIPFFGVTLLAMQSLYGTCVFMGASGMRDFGEGHEKIACPVTCSALRGQAKKIWAASIGGAATMTGLALASLAIR
jgi:hypothetical protein